MDSFGEILRSTLEEKSLSIRSFSKLINFDNSAVCKVLDGKRAPPLDQLENWIHALAIQNDNSNELHDKLRLSAYRAHCPLPILAYIDALEKRVLEKTSLPPFAAPLAE